MRKDFDTPLGPSAIFTRQASPKTSIFSTFFHNYNFGVVIPTAVSPWRPFAGEKNWNDGTLPAGFFLGVSGSSPNTEAVGELRSMCCAGGFVPILLEDYGTCRRCAAVLKMPVNERGRGFSNFTPLSELLEPLALTLCKNVLRASLFSSVVIDEVTEAETWPLSTQERGDRFV